MNGAEREARIVEAVGRLLADRYLAAEANDGRLEVTPDEYATLLSAVMCDEFLASLSASAVDASRIEPAFVRADGRRVTVVVPEWEAARS